MNFIRTCINRPVFTSVISLVLVTLGAIFFSKLEVRDTPNVSSPILTVSAYYAGADALYMEQKVTNPLEKILKTVKNLENMTSTSRAESTEIKLQFKMDADIEVALNDVRMRIGSTGHMFPDDMRLPSASKMDRSGQASIWIGINSTQHDSLELTRIIETQIKPSLERIPSVGEVQLRGTKYYNLYIEPMEGMMFRHSISPLEIEQAIRSQNRDYPAGSVQTNFRNYSLRIKSSLQSIGDFENVFLKKYDNGGIVKLKDVANVFVAASEDHVIMRSNGERAIAIGIVRQSNANDMELSKQVHKELAKLRKTLPESLKLDVIYDGSVYIKESIKSVFSAILEAILLVGAIIFLFLGSLRLTIIPLITIPISLLGTFSIMHWLGFSLNSFTLLAMALAVGLVVDDAIVMLENIFRHKNDLQKSKLKASEDGASEIFFAVVAMTITLASVFLPVGLMAGKVGKMFIEFAWTLAFCIIISGVVALTLTPMMASKILSDERATSFKYAQVFDRFFKKVQALYVKILELLLDKKWMISTISIFSAALFTIFSFKKVEKAYMPNEDIGILFVNYDTPDGTSIHETEKSVIEAEKFLDEEEGVSAHLSWIWSDGAMSFVPLKNWKDRKRSQDKIRLSLNKNFSTIQSGNVYAYSWFGGGGKGSGAKAEFNILSSLEYSELDALSQTLTEAIKADPTFKSAHRDFNNSQPMVDIIINKEKAYKYGVSTNNIGTTVEYLVKGKTVGDFRMHGEIYDAILRCNRDRVRYPEALKNIFVKNNSGKLLPIETVAELVHKVSVNSYKHHNGYRAIRMTADLAESTTMQDAVAAIDALAKNFIDPDSTRIEYLGAVRDMEESSNDTMRVFLFALLFIFLVLSAQFESFADSLLILMAVPFSITGGICMLWLLGGTLNVYSNIGFVTLIGLVTKNSIMIVEFANQLRASGLKARDAIVEASKLRFKPILMTSIATVLGAVPLVLATGAGAGARHSIGTIVVYGMSFGTLFTIFIVPVLYQIIKRDKGGTSKN